ncbi:RdgB/HAM1 family non-canonical purine NTP pyrophosphatase [Weeksellaceae bacterium KMM 9713]|uniref:dITP/XTP pyrophosphatase n=1 Tax=Profundicola chukchiensis TaxID=2961959 RepID=A0A9X4MYR1_9FLAO|nr:RdgB/HAM1 family non-canonical purine NTP pyrophosphatase [Profundicola chukchiensis]MDG4946593.1 RdgB/HAM1 family non-canonical purine NTP pyrophosphatase [Profundicola chukchiensis]
MSNKILFATHNRNKAKEVNQILSNFKIITLEDIDFHDEIIEDGKSFKENAKIKVDAIREKYDGSIFADDSGLVIPALNNEPGIYSSRYAGTGKSEDNIAKVLKELKDKEDRYAYFVAVICLYHQGEYHFFEGKVEGEILHQVEGDGGFGYDPIFKPKEFKKSFAEISPEEKNSISHRGRAIKAMKSSIFEQN